MIPLVSLARDAQVQHLIGYGLNAYQVVKLNLATGDRVAGRVPNLMGSVPFASIAW